MSAETATPRPAKPCQLLDADTTSRLSVVGAARLPTWSTSVNVCQVDVSPPTLACASTVPDALSSDTESGPENPIRPLGVQRRGVRNAGGHGNPPVSGVGNSHARSCRDLRHDELERLSQNAIERLGAIEAHRADRASAHDQCPGVGREGALVSDVWALKARLSTSSA